MFRMLVMSFVLLFVFSGAAWGATITLTDCSYSSVNNAVSAAKDGDIIVLAGSGTVSWASTLTIPDTKGITLQVRGGTNSPKTSANFPLTISSSADPIIRINCENNNSLTRITGFKFTNTIASNNGAIYVQGRGTGKKGLGAYRIDNNYFDSIQLPHAGLSGTITHNSSTGVMTGVIDNNTLHDCSYTDGYNIAVIEMWEGGHTHVSGDFSWAGQNAFVRPFVFGSSDFLFIENNLFETVNQYARHMIMGDTGAKYVARYNTFDINVAGASGAHTEDIDAHGLCICNSTGQGTRGGEIYGNTFKGTQNTASKALLRGGTWLVYDNTIITKTSGTSDITLKEYRANDTGGCSQCTTACTAINPWNACVTDSPSLYPLQQQISGSYFWNNKYSGTDVYPNVDAQGYQRFYIQPSRDYWQCTGLADAQSQGLSAGYKPYPYPHPLATVVTAYVQDTFDHDPGWALSAGTTYTYLLTKATYPGKQIGQVLQETTALSSVASLSLVESTAGSYYLDPVSGQFYVHCDASIAPNSPDPRNHLITIKSK